MIEQATSTFRREMNNRKVKRMRYALASAYLASPSRKSDQEFDWDAVWPVGREFGSPDYERLAKSDALAEASKIKRSM